MYSLVIPVYKNERNIDPLLAALEGLSARLDRQLEVIFVVDGSPDRSAELLAERLPHVSFPAELVELSRNFGAFAAVRMGLSVARGPYFAGMAADLQEPPELIEEFFRTLAREPFDVVVGTRSQRHDPPASRWFAETYWSIYRRWVQRDMPTGGFDVFACNEPVRKALLDCSEANSSLVGLLVWLGFRRKEIPYVRRARQIGKSGWSFRGKLRYMLDSMFAFSDLPIWFLTVIGAGGMGLSLLVALAVVVSWAVGNIPVAGYVPVILAVMFSMFLQMLSMGLLGGYVWRAFENTKRRPLFLPMSQRSFRREPQANPTRQAA